MRQVFLCDYIRTPVGRYGGALSAVRPDDLAAGVLSALMERNRGTDWAMVDDVIFGCVNQAGEDNRNIARMALLLAGLPETVPGATVNRLCGSGMSAHCNCRPSNRRRRGRYDHRRRGGKHVARALRHAQGRNSFCP